MSDYFSDFISGVYDDLGQPDDYSLVRLSGWFLDEANVGYLNNLIGKDYVAKGAPVSGCNVDPTAPIPNSVLNIYKLLFNYNYYLAQSRASVLSLTSAANNWTSLQEADSKITRVNPNEVAKTFRGLAKDTKEELAHAVKMYLKYNATPQQVVGDDNIGVIDYNIHGFSRGNYYGF